MRSVLVLVGVIVVCATSVSQAQVSWDVFDDTESTSTCDIVNTADSELVVLSATGQLMIVSGVDTILTDTFVRANGDVDFEGNPTGFIGFAEDADGFRTLWWQTIGGRVVQLDAFDAEPFESDLAPSDFASVPCDACEFVDDPPFGVCDGDLVIDIPPISVDFCGTGVASNAFLTMSFCGFVGLRLTRRW